MQETISQWGLYITQNSSQFMLAVFADYQGLMGYIRQMTIGTHSQHI